MKVRQRLIFEIIKNKLEWDLLYCCWGELKEAITLINEFALKEHKNELLQMAYKYNEIRIKKEEEIRQAREKRSQARKAVIAKKKQQEHKND